VCDGQFARLRRRRARLRSEVSGARAGPCDAIGAPPWAPEAGVAPHGQRLDRAFAACSRRMPFRGTLTAVSHQGARAFVETSARCAAEPCGGATGRGDRVDVDRVLASGRAPGTPAALDVYRQRRAACRSRGRRARGVRPVCSLRPEVPSSSRPAGRPSCHASSIFAGSPPLGCANPYAVGSKLTYNGWSRRVQWANGPSLEYGETRRSSDSGWNPYLDFSPLPSAAAASASEPLLCDNASSGTPDMLSLL
jgi:hypothetical protein